MFNTSKKFLEKREIRYELKSLQDKKDVDTI